MSVSANTPAAGTPATVDRQQRTRDRISEVEAQLSESAAQVDAATKMSLGTADKLEKQRGALRAAEQEHSRAVSRLEAVEAERQQLQGELTSLNRRLQMATAIRKARA